MATERVGSQSVHLQHQSFYAADGGEQSFDDFDLVKKRKKIEKFRQNCKSSFTKAQK